MGDLRRGLAAPSTGSPGDGSPGDGVFGLDDSPERAKVVLLPVPWEATTSYGRGTAGAPAAIAKASVQLDLFDVALARPYQAGIAMLPPDPELVRVSAEASLLAERVIAAFNAGKTSEAEAECARVNEHSAWLNAWLKGESARWLDRDKLLGLVGGDHSVAFGAIAAHAEHFGQLGVLQFDAHADLRVAYQGFEGSHASVMHRVLDEIDQVQKLVSVGVRDLSEQEYQAIVQSSGRVTAFFDDDIARELARGTAFATIAQQIANELPPQVYVSFDVDGLDPLLCPHTGTPVPGGLSFHQAMAILSAVVDSGRRIVGFDLCEVAPGPGPDEWDANVGARLLYKLIGYALASQQDTAGRNRSDLLFPGKTDTA